MEHAPLGSSLIEGLGRHLVTKRLSQLDYFHICIDCAA
jgi:hypothetical protein